MWRDPGAPADSFYQVRPECTDVPKTRFRIKVSISPILFFNFVILIDLWSYIRSFSWKTNSLTDPFSSVVSSSCDCILVLCVFKPSAMVNGMVYCLML